MKFIPDDVRARTWKGDLGFQMADELDRFLSLIKDCDVRSFLEIGSRDGGTFHAVMSSLPAGSKGVAVDLPGEAWGKGSSGPRLQEAVDDLKTRGYDVSAIFGDSRSPVVIEQVIRHGPFDAILIDGDHRYDGVKADWETYSDIGWLIAFHDIAGDGYSVRDGTAVIEVGRLWKEIRDNYDHFEIIADRSIMGIGVILK